MLIILYISAICLANLLVARFGAPVTPVSAFFLIALDMSIRDKLHDYWGSGSVARMPTLIAAAGIISYSINPATGIIAIASLAAFSLSAIVDSVIYHALIDRRWVIKSNFSNVAGSAVDSIIFPIIAFGTALPEVVISQFAAKVFGGMVFSFILIRIYENDAQKIQSEKVDSASDQESA